MQLYYYIASIFLLALCLAIGDAFRLCTVDPFAVESTTNARYFQYYSISNKEHTRGLYHPIPLRRCRDSRIFVQPEQSPEPKPPSTSEELKAVVDEASRVITRLKSLLLSFWGYLQSLKDIPEERSKLRATVKSNVGILLTSAARNMQEGELGSRGEQWFVIQLLIAGMVLFGVNPLVADLIRWSAGWYVLGGLLLMGGGLLELKDSLTPFPAPASNNTLTTTGAYKVVRHPMYGGILLFCTGVSIGSHHDGGEKMLLTILLGFVLNYKANLEESLLRQKHPEAYDSFVLETKSKLIPYIL